MSTRAGILLVVVASFPVLPARTQETPDSAGADARLAASVRVIEDRIAAIVGVEHPASISATRVDEATRAASLASRVQSWLPPERAAARGRAWRDIGLGTGSDPGDLVAAIARDLPGMSLDAERRRLLVDPSRLPSDVARGDPDVDPDASVMLATGLAPDEPVAGHYIVHALLDGPAPVAASTTDALLARAALSEGTANLAALVLLFGGVGLESAVVSGKVRPDDALGGRLVPAAVREASPTLASLLQFVYLDGFAQASVLAKRGGFRRLSQERAARGVTRDVIHADRAPASVAAIPPPPVPPGLELTAVDQDSLGEEGIVALVSLVTGKDNLGMIAGDGWAGDSLFRLEPRAAGASPGDGLTLWVTEWSSEEDARDFAYSLERCLQARFPGEEMIAAATAFPRILKRSDQIFTIDKNGTEVRFRVAPPSVEAKLNPEQKKKVPPAPTQRPKK